MAKKLQVNNTHQTEGSTQELFKALRSNIEFTGTENQVIAITSCQPNDGKSQIAFNLTKTFAGNGKNAILVDADMRKSVLMNRLKIVQKLEGLSHYLSGQTPLLDVICTTDVPGFYILPAGQFPPNPAELLDNSRFDKMLETLRKNFDYVIIDTPPLGSVIDAAIIAKKCDGSIMTIAANTISRKMAAAVKNQLAMANPNVLGVILNKVQKKNGRGYYNGYYSGYYNSYGGYGVYGSESGNAVEEDGREAFDGTK